jgi:hypothetical protein
MIPPAGALTPGAANPLANPAAYIENVAGHALIGCASSAASGGSCASGALSAGISDAAGPFINGSNQAASLISNAVVGGLASVAGGGKFANGAVTGAFGYLVALGPVSSSSGGTGDPMDAHAEDYPFQQAAATQGFSGPGPDIIGSLGQAWLSVMSVVGLSPELGAGEAGGVLTGANYAQNTFSAMFSKGGTFAGQSVADVADALLSGALSPGDVPVQYIVRDGNTLILNTRSAQALEQAGIPRGSWNAVDMTGNTAAEARLTGQLGRNGLTSLGTPTVSPRGN